MVFPASRTLALSILSVLPLQKKKTPHVIPLYPIPASSFDDINYSLVLLYYKSFIYSVGTDLKTKYHF